MLYFDHNATAPLCSAARNAWLEAVEKYVGNPSSPHRLGSRADHAVANASETVSQILGCAPEEIVWTSGATESNNTVISHFARQPSAEVWVSAIEHPSVIEPATYFFKNRCRFIPVDHRGTVEVGWLERELRARQPAFVAVMAANNETGVLQPWREIRELCAAREVPFFCDAAQSVGKLSAANLGDPDFLSIAPHKFGGPQGIGILKGGHDLDPLLRGGPQQELRRAGTENVAAILAATAALVDRTTLLKTGGDQTRQAWRDEFCATLRASIPGISIVGDNASVLWNTVSAIMPPLPKRTRWVVKLDKLGAAVSTGSACSSGSEKPSHVLAAMGFSAEQTSQALRFSSGWETRREDWTRLGELVVAASNS